MVHTTKLTRIRDSRCGLLKCTSHIAIEYACGRVGNEIVSRSVQPAVFVVEGLCTGLSECVERMEMRLTAHCADWDTDPNPSLI